jgi:hypothetical protein
LNRRAAAETASRAQRLAAGRAEFRNDAALRESTLRGIEGK